MNRLRHCFSLRAGDRELYRQPIDPVRGNIVAAACDVIRLSMKYIKHRDTVGFRLTLGVVDHENVKGPGRCILFFDYLSGSALTIPRLPDSKCTVYVT